MSGSERGRDPNRNALWARALVEELVAGGVEAACVAPGSRSTPLTVALAAHEKVRIFSHLDERAAAFFALGRAKRTGDPTPLVCTSGTAAANFHPAVLEADRGRVPVLLLTADRPPELTDTGANQTADQEKLYGDAVRWYRDLPEPTADARKLRALRTTVGRALSASVGPPAGPVHLNCRFRKPLEPVEVPGDVPAGFPAAHPEAAEGRESPYVETYRGASRLDAAALDEVAASIDAAERGLVVCGPADEATPSRGTLAALADATGFPVLADPLSGARFGAHVPGRPILGGYDAYLDERVTRTWPSPDVVLRFGASPTSKTLRQYLARTGARQYLVDPAPAGWREAEFRVTDRLVADPDATAAALAHRVSRDPDPNWPERLDRAERIHWSVARDAPAEMEGSLLRRAVADAPDPATLFVSNSMPVRDLDRFGAPRGADLRILGNRGLSGIDGVTSTALGAGSATADPLVLVTGDLAYYHDMNGLLALARCGVDATVVLVNNDGGGIFHMLPIEDFDPPFTEHFETPHGLNFAPTGDLYGFEYVRASPGEFGEVYRAALASTGTRIIEVRTDAEASHRERERLRDRLVDRLAESE
jgi:2-succinyl-5-enolpyruvyl-6-hydroxy-3-cyclohexene-1-carboxylate synthase